MSDRVVYMNRRSGKRAVIIQTHEYRDSRLGTDIKAKFLGTGYEVWYNGNDFIKQFREIKKV